MNDAHPQNAIDVAVGENGIALVLHAHPPAPPHAEGAEPPPSEQLVLSLAAARELLGQLRDMLGELGREPPAAHPRREADAHDRAALAITYANSTAVSAHHDQVAISFGIEKARRTTGSDAEIEPVRQVTLGATAAEQLAVDLSTAVAPRAVTGADEEPARSGSEDRVDRILTLFQQVGRLYGKIDFEPSIKVAGGQLFENRFLLGFDRREAGDSRDDVIASICENIGMPGGLLNDFSRGLSAANHVYFGVEKSDQALLFKAYLEFRDRAEQESGDDDASGRCFHLFTGFKWNDTLPQQQAISRYDWYPSLSVSDMLERVSAIGAVGRDTGLLELARGLVREASRRTSAADIQYLEVTEDGNPRRSFDMNIYKSALTLEDVSPDLLRALRSFDVPFARFEPLYRRIKAERCGHLAGGIDREDNDFMTVYYGVKDIHSSQLAGATIAQPESPPRPLW